MDRLFERIVSLVDGDSIERVRDEESGVVVLVRDGSVCRGVNCRWKTERSRSLAVPVLVERVVLRVEGVVGAVERVVMRSVSRLPIRLPMLLVRPGLSVPEGLDTDGVRPKIELRVCDPFELLRGDVVGTLGERVVGVDGATRLKVVGVRTLDRGDVLG